MSITSDANFLGGSPFGGFGGGWGGIAPIGLFGVANGLFGRDGRGDCGDGTNNAVFGATILSKLGSIEGAVPLAAANIENSILTQTAALNDQINQVGLANLAATAGVKDTVMNSATAALLNANSNTQSILGAICNLSSKIDQNTITDLQTQLLRAESHGRSRETEVNITQSVNQNQAQLQFQQQQQAQFGQLTSLLTHLFNDIQAVKQGQTVVNTGLMGAATNTATANNVKTA